jgi:hypothetical protein
MVSAYQYSAILDSVTTDLCAGLHGKIFDAGDQPVPPLHFNCRSLLVPITKYESYEPDTKVGSIPIDKFIDDRIGDGFSRYALPEKKKPKKVSIHDKGVTHSTAVVSETEDLITYSINGKPFKEVSVIYDSERLNVLNTVERSI